MADEQNPSEAVDTGVSLPEDLTSVNDGGLQSLKQKIAAKFDKYRDKESLSGDDLAVMSALRDQMTAVRGEETTRATAQAEAQATRDQLIQDMDGSPEGEAEEGEADAGSGDALDNVVPIEAVSGEAEAENSDGAETEAPGGMDALAAALVAAVRSASAPATPAAPARPKTTVAERALQRGASVRDLPAPGSNIAITAAAGIDRVQMGTTLDRAGLGEALHQKARMLPDGAGRRDQHLVASIDVIKPRNDFRSLKSDSEIGPKFQEMFKIPEQGLVASGGWCSVSETIYDFVCDYEEMPETWDTPSATANRGGLRYPTSPLLGDVLDDINSGFTWTEADDIAAAQPGGPTKPCYRIPCPEFEEARLQAQGVCVTVGNLMDRSWPELVDRYMDLVMTAHAHRMNGLRIARGVAASTPVSPTVTDLSATEALLAGLELQIACLRDEFFMGADFVFEGVAPRWARTVIRRDLARRAGVPFNQVTNADINALFNEIGARIQFVSNWQSLRGVADPGCLTLPESVNVLLYPAGAHTFLDGGSLDLGVIRDSTLNETNDYTAMWTEEFWGYINRCVSLNVEIPLCANGSTGVASEITCPSA